MTPQQIFRRGPITAEVLAPGLFRVQKQKDSGKEVITINSNTDHVLWQEDRESDGASSITIGLSRPFHLFRGDELQRRAAPDASGEFEPVTTLEDRAAELLQGAREFLKQNSVTMGPDSGTLKRFEGFLSGLDSRPRLNPYAVRPGETVALFIGDKRRRVLLMKVLKTGEEEWGKFVMSEGVMVDRKPDGSLGFTYHPGSEIGGGRPLSSEDQMVAINADELLQFYLPDSRQETESVRFFEKQARLDGEWGRTASNPTLRNFLKGKSYRSIGGVAV